MDGGRKSVEPLANRIAGAGVHSLRQTVDRSSWVVEPIQQQLAGQGIDVVAGPELCGIDDGRFRAGTYDLWHGQVEDFRPISPR